MKVKVNELQLNLPPNTSAIDAVFAAGYDVPYFCSHEYMSPIGACRMCLAKIGAPRKDRASGEWILDEETKEPKVFWFPNPMATCTTAIMEGMVIDTLCEEAKKAQAGMIELHLINHPLDCPTCDKGGACELQDRSYEYGQGESRFIFDKRHQEKHHALSDLITLDRERCIHCKRCVRYFEEVPGDEVLDFIERGGHTYIGNIEQGLPSNFSGNIADICPVGALLDTTARFRGRNWEYSHTHSISMNDASGAAIAIDARTGHIERVRAALNPEINKVWIDDGTRFGYEYVNSKERIKKPLIRKGDKLTPTTWTEASAYIQQKLTDLVSETSNKIGIALRADATLEEAVAAKALAKELNTSKLTHYPSNHVITLGQQATYTDVATSDALLVIADVSEELPILDLRIKDALKGVPPAEMMSHGVPIADLRLKERMPHKKEILTVAAPYPVDLMKYAEQSLVYKAGEEVQLITDLPTKIINQLNEAENAVIILGGFVLANPDAVNKICSLATEVNAKVMAIGPMANSYGLAAMNFTTTSYNNVINDDTKALIVSELNLAQDPRALKNIEFLVVHSSFLNEITEHADVVIPAKTSFEKQGTVRNVEGRYLKVNPAPVNSGSAVDFVELVEYLGLQLDLKQALIEEFGFDFATITTEGYLPTETSKGIKDDLQNNLQDNVEQDNHGKDVLIVPTMVKSEYLNYNPHFYKMLGEPALKIHPDDAKNKKLQTGDVVIIQVGELKRRATIKISDKTPKGLMLLPALPEQPSGLYALKSLEIENAKLEVA